MAFADVIGTIETHAIAAGAALTVPLTDVVIGPPIPTSARCVRVSWDGMGDPGRMGANETLTGRMVSDRIVVTGFWAFSTQSTGQYRVLMLEMRAFADQIWTRILGDATLDGNVTDLDVELPTVDYIAVNNVPHAMVVFELEPQFTEYPIAP